MLAKTENGKKIRKYHVKLEQLYNQLVNDEINEKSTRLEELEHYVHTLENKPDTFGFLDRKAGDNYIIKVPMCF